MKVLRLVYCSMQIRFPERSELVKDGVEESEFEVIGTADRKADCHVIANKYTLYGPRFRRVNNQLTTCEQSLIELNSSL